MKILWRFVLLAALMTVLCQSVSAQTQDKSSRKIAVRCGRLLDVKTGKMIEKAVIIIQGERIEQVGAQLLIPAGAEVIDLESTTVLPGLIDCHTHLLSNLRADIPEDENIILSVTQMSTAKRALLGENGTRGSRSRHHNGA